MTLEKPNVSFAFSDGLSDTVTDYDIVMAYEVFLGRPPENSTVISSHRVRRFDDLVRTFTNSGEFVLSTVEPVRNAMPVRRLDHTKAPARNHVSWLLDHIVLDHDDEILLYGATSWEEFFRLFLSLGRAAGMAPRPRAADAPSDVSAAPAAAPLLPEAERSAAVQARLAQIAGLVAEIRALLQSGAGCEAVIHGPVL